MEVERRIHKENVSDVVISDISTGLDRVGDTYVAPNGLEYFSGVRDFDGLQIIELLCRGIGVAYLTRVRVFDSSNKLIIDVPVPKGISYSREVVRKIVLKELVEMLEEAANTYNQIFHKEAVYDQVDMKLKNVYYSQSYEAVLNWAITIGIQLNK